MQLKAFAAALSPARYIAGYLQPYFLRAPPTCVGREVAGSVGQRVRRRAAAVEVGAGGGEGGGLEAATRHGGGQRTFTPIQVDKTYVDTTQATRPACAGPSGGSATTIFVG
jgi:hypothetical protein